jgi:EAL domain-containing protein (putative c-di-GMP-specific phosphodiesterase class I)
LQLAVNVSARQFGQADFVRSVQQVLQSTGANPQRLKLELTESLVIANVQDTVMKMEALKALGVRFSIDDFGTGQSSLAYLTTLPLDQLKIDQSFVRNIGQHARDAVVIDTIIGMAHNLGLEVIAEGAETAAQRSFLLSHGCKLFQGYLFAKPVPIGAFEHALNRDKTEKASRASDSH